MEYSVHSLEQMALRGIDKTLTDLILLKPDQVIQQENLTVYQSIIKQNNKNYLIRIFVNLQKLPPLVVTVYKTSQTQKYLNED
jgi:hypothetical protein